MAQSSTQRRERSSSDQDHIVMPVQLTTAMRAAAVKVPLSITIAEEPYLDRLYAALVEACRAEQ